MKKKIPLIFATILSLTSILSMAAEALDPRLVGSWQGMREQSGKCQFLAWNSKFSANGNFEISFFADKERLKPVQIERGNWKASNGKSELKTDGVLTSEVYIYTIINDDTIKYVNTVKDPTADCQADYEFTEYRVKK
ncbi:lipocalin family protein [Limnohabitans sp.]|uniref:lipocalin family protein n=1 Tax=Limnohabitans sp. TaxID=1907725 RepID=UPI0025BF2DB9|nr:lipocalin family protein [Limnohabitans sp.]